MEILLNDKNEVISYVTLGEIDGAIEAEVPDNFIENFKPRYYRYIDNAVAVNPEYEAPMDFDNGGQTQQEINVILTKKLAETKASLETTQAGIVSLTKMVAEAKGATT